MKRISAHNIVNAISCVFSVLVVFSVFLTAHAQQASESLQSESRFTGSYVYEVCARDPYGKETVAGGHIACQSYISGIVDYHNFMQTLGSAEPDIHICIPSHVGLNDLQDVVWRYFSEHPANDPFVAGPTIVLALSEYYPCKKKEK